MVYNEIGMKKITLPGIAALAFFAFSACNSTDEQQGAAPHASLQTAQSMSAPAPLEIPPPALYEPGGYTAERFFFIEIINDGAEAMVRGFNAAAGSNISIPPYIQGLPVTAIRFYAFQNRRLTSVVLPEGITHIGRSAFERNHLTRISIPGSVAYIGSLAFSRNYLTEVELRSGIAIIGDLAFANNQIRYVAIPNSVFSIREKAFERNQLTEVCIPESVLIIGWNAFAENPLTEVVIPRNIPLGSRSFDDGVTVLMPAPAPNEILPAIPLTVTVSVNGRQFSAPAWNVRGASYFRVRDIAYMLNDTRAQFSIVPGQPQQRWHQQADYWLQRWRPYIPTGAEMGALAAGARQAELVRDSRRAFDGITVSTAFPRRPILSHFDLDTALIDGQSYFNLASFGQMLGFDLSVDAATGAIAIDTREPAISEYGLRVAREFLLAYRTLHDPDAIPERLLLEEGPWPRVRLVDRLSGMAVEPSLYRNRGGYVSGYFLHDFRGNGIPEIVINWYSLEAMGTRFLYVYRNGAFVPTLTLGGRDDIFSDGQGHIYFTRGGVDGARVYRVMFEDDEMHSFEVGAWFTPDHLFLNNDAGASHQMRGYEFLALRREGLLGNLLDDFPEFALYMERREYLDFARPLDVRIFPRSRSNAY